MRKDGGIHSCSATWCAAMSMGPMRAAVAQEAASSACSSTVRTKIWKPAFTTGAISAQGGKRSTTGKMGGFIPNMNLLRNMPADRYSATTVAAPAAPRPSGSVGCGWRLVRWGL